MSDDSDYDADPLPEDYRFRGSSLESPYQPRSPVLHPGRAIRTTFPEFTRRLRESSQPAIDLRALDYTSSYDPHLMCPICHIPFIDPVVLDCDHTFCSSCYDELRYGVPTSNRGKCPSCRSAIQSNPRKASRLIRNMCNEVKVQCSNRGCKRSMARQYIETHMMKTCPEQPLICPVPACNKMTRRKDYIIGFCDHAISKACSCGAIVEPGDEMEKHQDEECPNKRTTCDDCGEKISSNPLQAGKHVCRPEADKAVCPGEKFGCTDEILPDNLESHISNCTLARLTPHLNLQHRLLESIQEQLTDSKLQNASLEAELDRMNYYIHEDLHVKLKSLQGRSSDQNSDIEEIPRENGSSAAAVHHRDLVLPAHLRDLTPSPELFSFSHDHTQVFDHFLNSQETFRQDLSNIGATVQRLENGLIDLEARLHTQIMATQHRLNEDLHHTSGLLRNQRNQIQYLLRMNRVGAQSYQPLGQGTNDTERQTLSTVTPSSSTQPQQTPGDGFPFPNPGASMTRTMSENGGGSGPSSASTSPVFSGIGLNGSRRPSMRGGSQERGKL